MFKSLITLTAIVVLALILLPNITGRVAESATHQLTEQINADGAAYGQIKVVDYQRGFLSTQSSFHWQPNSALTAVVEQPLDFDCAGKHGVLSYSYQCKAREIPRYTDFVRQQLGGQDPLTFTGKVSLFGRPSQRITLDAFEITEPQGDSLRVLPATLTIVSDHELSAFKFNGEFSGLNAKGQDGLMTVDKVSLVGDVSVNEMQLIIGHLSMELDSVALESPAEGNLSIKGLTMRSQSRELGKNISIDSNLSAAEILQTKPGFLAQADNPIQPLDNQVSGQAGSQIDIKNLAFDLQMAGIDMTQLAILNEKMMALIGQTGAAGSGSASDKLVSNKNASLLRILPDVEALLKPGLALNANLSADYMAEPLTTEIDLRLLGSLSLGDFILLRVSPGSVFAKIEANIETNVPLSFLDNHPQVKNTISNSPWYKKSGRNYTSSFQMAEDQVSLNGKQLSTQELLALIRPRKHHGIRRD